MPNAKLTKRFVDEIPLRSAGQEYFWDTELPAFGLVVGKTSKSYIVQRRINGKNKRITIGKHMPFTPDTARKEAMELLRQMSMGDNPTEIKRKENAKSISVEQVFSTFKKERDGHLSPKTMRNYVDFMNNHLSNWKKKPLREITTDMIISRHREIGSNAGKYAANSTFKFLQGLYNYAGIEDIDLINPVHILTKKKLWYPRERRNTFIRESDLGKWHEAVLSLSNHSIRDCLRLLLFTGLRRTEACTLEWKNVDFKERTIFIPHTKNKRPLTLPMSSYIYKMLKERFESRGTSPWVFPGEGKFGHISELRKSCDAVENACGVKFMPHDLRRTYITIAEPIAPSQYSLKRLLNHTTSNDVTAGYIILDVERLRDVVESIAKKITSCLTA